MRRYLPVTAVAFIVAGVAHAGTVTLSGALSGANENPPNASTGTGLATVTLDTTAHSLMVDVLFSNLLSTTTASHIHCCVAPPGNAMVATTVPTFPGFPLGVTAGTYVQTFDLLSSASYNPAFITANGGTVASADAAFESGLLNFRTYLNIHTNQFPGGEIRAFLTPEPTTAALALSACAAFWLMRRKRAARPGR